MGPRRALALLGLGFLLARAGTVLARSWQARVAVTGGSMAPTLRSGDWLLVDPGAYRRRRPLPGELVVARDPDATDRWLVKRAVAGDGRGGVMLGGDHPDSSPLRSVAPAAIAGRPWFRYWPVGRMGVIGAVPARGARR